MARLWTSGFESGAVGGLDGNVSGGTVSFVTSPVRSGAFAAGIAGAASGAIRFTNTGVLGRTYFARIYLRVETLFDSPFGMLDLGSGQITVALTTSGTLQLRIGGVGFQTQVGSDSAALTLGQWYIVEVSGLTNTGSVDTAAARLDGVQFASGTGLAISDVTIDRVQIGVSSSVPGTGATTVGQMYLDDLAWNDDQGASQNSWPGTGSVVMLKPKADSARGANWLAGAGATTNLWDAVDNTPPVGLVLASATNTSQVKNAAKDTTGLYDASVEAYDVAVASGGGGLVTADTITLAQPVASVGASGAAIQHGLAVASNPVIAEATVTTSTSAAGTWPSNWINLLGTISYAPTPTRATRPVLRLRKGTSSTTAAMAAFMGLLVEYVPAVTAAPQVFPKVPHRGLYMRRRT